MEKNKDCRYFRLSDEDRIAISVIAALIKESVEFFDEISLNPSYGKPISNALIKLCTLLEEHKIIFKKPFPIFCQAVRKRFQMTKSILS